MIAVGVAEAVEAPATALAGVRRVGRVALIATFALIVVALGFLTLARPFGIGTVLTHGVSMGRTVPNGSLAVTRDTPAASVRPGDIIVIDTAATKVHRVIAVHELDGKRLVQTQGDATGGPDPGFSALGSDSPRVIAVVPLLGFVVAFAMSPLGWLILVVMPLAWLLASFLRGVWARGDAEER